MMALGVFMLWQRTHIRVREIVQPSQAGYRTYDGDIGKTIEKTLESLPMQPPRPPRPDILQTGDRPVTRKRPVTGEIPVTRERPVTRETPPTRERPLTRERPPTRETPPTRERPLTREMPGRPGRPERLDRPMRPERSRERLYYPGEMSMVVGMGGSVGGMRGML